MNDVDAIVYCIADARFVCIKSPQLCTTLHHKSIR